MFEGLLLALTFAPVIFATTMTNCPDKCSCRKPDPYLYIKSAYNRTDILIVICPFEPSIPDLSPLKEISSDKLFVFRPTDENKKDGNITLRKEDFPRGLRITELLFRRINTIHIDDDALENLQLSLLRLDLAYSGLEVKGPLMFLSGLIRLDILELYNNYGFWSKRRRDAMGSVFNNMGLEKLRVLSLAECSIYEMTDDALSGLEGLVELDLSKNKFQVVPRTIGLLKNLEELDLSKNKIQTLKGALFKGNRKLKKLMLYGNADLEIKYDAFKGLEESLAFLDLQSTGQKQVPTVAFYNLKQLNTLNISDNPVTEMETGSFKGSYCLRELNMAKIMVQIALSVFDGQKNCIKVIHLSGNWSGSVPTQALSSFTKLEYLVYSHESKMKTLKQGSFSGIRAKTIRLQNLIVTSIGKGAFDNVHTPLRLYIESIAISDLSFVMDYPKGTFELLSIEDVPVSCDCHLVKPVERLECALTGRCQGEYPYYYVDEQALREKLSKTCPNAPDFTLMYLKCDVSSKPALCANLLHTLSAILLTLGLIV